MIEEKEYDVTLTLRISTWVPFAPAERDGPLRPSDAVDNAIGMIPESVFEALRGEGFEIALPIDGEAVEVTA